VVDLDSPFDRWARGDDRAMSEPAKRGFELFVGKAGCAICHSGPNFADKRFHNIGTAAGDPGRMAVTKEKADLGAYKTPTVRNVALTGPYMHDGSQRTLRQVIDHYEKVPTERDRHPNLSFLLREFKLDEREKGDLEAFMRALTGDVRDARINVVPELPQ
jgi:cytochrome c peroxidase